MHVIRLQSAWHSFGHVAEGDWESAILMFRCLYHRGPATLTPSLFQEHRHYLMGEGVKNPPEELLCQV